jgi:hypothetical protein
MPQYSPTQVAQMVINQGGTKPQAWVAAALVDGIESNGSPTDANPNSTACGLFQFLTSKWISSGGGQYAPTACGATWEEQISVFITATGGNNFYAWAPDLGGSYNGNTKQPAATSPQSGSPVANKISTLASTGTLSFLGNVPSNWTDVGGTTPTTGIWSLVPGGGSSVASGGGTCRWSINFGVLGNICLLSSTQIKWLSGMAALAGGAVLGTFGVIMVAAAVGKSLPTPSLPSLPSRSAPAPAPAAAADDDLQGAFAEGMAQGQSTNPQHQARRQGYEREREGVRRAGAPVSKSRPKIPKAAPELAAF